LEARSLRAVVKDLEHVVAIDEQMRRSDRGTSQLGVTNCWAGLPKRGAACGGLPGKSRDDCCEAFCGCSRSLRNALHLNLAFRSCSSSRDKLGSRHGYGECNLLHSLLSRRPACAVFKDQSGIDPASYTQYFAALFAEPEVARTGHADWEPAVAPRYSLVGGNVKLDQTQHAPCQVMRRQAAFWICTMHRSIPL
jgi:hypothetical protein